MTEEHGNALDGHVGLKQPNRERIAKEVRVAAWNYAGPRPPITRQHGAAHYRN